VVSTTDPYFTQDGISRTVDLYYRTSRPVLLRRAWIRDLYKIVTKGASSFGVPFSEIDTVFFGVGWSRPPSSPAPHAGGLPGYINQFGLPAPPFPDAGLVAR
jgi:outer membrane protein insertion porin family